MLTDLSHKIKAWIKENQGDLFLAAVIFLVGLTSFGLGRLSAVWPQKEPVRIDQTGKIDHSAFGLGEAAPDNFTKRSDSPPSSVSPAEGGFVASKNGSAYHYPWCPSARQIKEENKVWFSTAGEARKAGYKPAGNCPGL